MDLLKKTSVTDTNHHNNFASGRLFRLCKRIYRFMPSGIRTLLAPLRWTVSFILSLRMDLWVITGQGGSGTKPLCFLYAGGKENKSYLIKLAFDDSYEEKHIGRMWIWEAIGKIKKGTLNGSITAVQINSLLRLFFINQKWLYIPCWIIGEVDISEGISSLITKQNLKSDIRKIRQNNLSAEISHNISDLRYFYDKMYLPYITNTYGDETFLAEYDLLKDQFKTCDLLLIKKNEEYIGGLIICYQKNSARLWCLGVKDGNKDYLHQGVSGAIYFFSLCRLKDRGFTKVGLGHTRTFLNDGVLRYKKKWSMRIISQGQTGFLVKMLSQNNLSEGFFLRNPFIHVNKERMEGAVFIENDRTLSEKDFKKLYSIYYSHGISKLIIYRFGEYSGKVEQSVPRNLSNIIEIRHAGSLF